MFVSNSNGPQKKKTRLRNSKVPWWYHGRTKHRRRPGVEWHNNADFDRRDQTGPGIYLISGHQEYDETYEQWENCECVQRDRNGPHLEWWDRNGSHWDSNQDWENLQGMNDIPQQDLEWDVSQWKDRDINEYHSDHHGGNDREIPWQGSESLHQDWGDREIQRGRWRSRDNSAHGWGDRETSPRREFDEWREDVSFPPHDWRDEETAPSDHPHEWRNRENAASESMDRDREHEWGDTGLWLHGHDRTSRSPGYEQRDENDPQYEWNHWEDIHNSAHDEKDLWAQHDSGYNGNYGVEYDETSSNFEHQHLRQAATWNMFDQGLKSEHLEDQYRHDMQCELDEEVDLLTANVMSLSSAAYRNLDPALFQMGENLPFSASWRPFANRMRRGRGRTRMARSANRFGRQDSNVLHPGHHDQRNRPIQNRRGNRRGGKNRGQATSVKYCDKGNNRFNKSNTATSSMRDLKSVKVHEKKGEEGKTNIGKTEQNRPKGNMKTDHQEGDDIGASLVTTNKTPDEISSETLKVLPEQENTVDEVHQSDMRREGNETEERSKHDSTVDIDQQSDMSVCSEQNEDNSFQMTEEEFNDELFRRLRLQLSLVRDPTDCEEEIGQQIREMAKLSPSLFRRFMAKNANKLSALMLMQSEQLQQNSEQGKSEDVEENVLPADSVSEMTADSMKNRNSSQSENGDVTEILISDGEGCGDSTYFNEDNTFLCDGPEISQNTSQSKRISQKFESRKCNDSSLFSDQTKQSRNLHSRKSKEDVKSVTGFLKGAFTEQDEVDSAEIIKGSKPDDTMVSETASSSERSSALRHGSIKEITSRQSDRGIDSAVHYKYVDRGNHCCLHCNFFANNLTDFFTHLSSSSHQKKQPDHSRLWQNKADRRYTQKSVLGKVEERPIKGAEMMVATTAFFCPVCQVTCEDKKVSEAHLKSDKHYNKYKAYLSRHPSYERRYKLKCWSGRKT